MWRLSSTNYPRNKKPNSLTITRQMLTIVTPGLERKGVTTLKRMEFPKADVAAMLKLHDEDKVKYVD